MTVRRIFVEKKMGFNVEAEKLYNELTSIIQIQSLKEVRIINRYDIESINDEIYNQSRYTIFAEPPVDTVYDEELTLTGEYFTIAVELLPGQYDQRADSAAQCIQLLAHGDRPVIKYAKLYLLRGNISPNDILIIKKHLINPVEAREALLSKPNTLVDYMPVPENVLVLDGFIDFDEAKLAGFISELGLAMDIDDVKFCQKYFKTIENRNPTLTEIRILDTYWSDHCRHTTFLTRINAVEFEDGKYTRKIKEVYNDYLNAREFVYGERIKSKDICLMDIATLAMKKLKKEGKLSGLDESDEINACSIEIKADIDGVEEDWLVMFKNETHNHPTEIEPFGGAATCLGGAIRDPLSGRAYVYQAMRITGAGDPTIPITETMPGKLPQRQICSVAAHGYSSYGNQIGLTTGLVDEIYHPGYVAKRMEIGAVIAAAPKSNVIRKNPEPGDIVILLGGRTGRDGCGGATGSSKAHTEESLVSCGAEVQKGNAPEERKIQRLFRNSEVTKLIKKCNDFGAGGVSVAVGELADGLEIYLDKVPKKYEGLDGTELAISESQERMACVVAPEDEAKFKELAESENLEAVSIALVTVEKRVKMFWRNNKIVDITRDFLNSNGATKETKIKVNEPIELKCDEEAAKDIKNKWLELLSELNVCSKKGLVEMFDCCVGASNIIYPFGGKYQLTPSENMVSKLPLLNGNTNTATVMSYGYDPLKSSWSPFHGAVYAVVESVAKLVISGARYQDCWFTFQEYFERLKNQPERWGKPFAALLGAFYAQNEFDRAAIGGKDSMSGSFNDLDVPPTLVSFAVAVSDSRIIVTPEFKKAGNKIIYLPVSKDEFGLPDFIKLKLVYDVVYNLIKNKKIFAANVVKSRGIAETLAKMSFGNKLGIEFLTNFDLNLLFKEDIGGLVLEVAPENLSEIDEAYYFMVGEVTNKPSIECKEFEINLEEMIINWEKKLESVYPTKVKANANHALEEFSYINSDKRNSKFKTARPKVLVMAFPGTNSEYDSARCFNEAGAISEIMPFRNLNSHHIELSIKEMADKIGNSQILMIPGGFSAGDEPEGSGKFITSVFRNPRIKDAVNDLLKNRDGLILGICNGFQALIKLGLVPFGEITELNDDAPTLTLNNIGRHVSKIVYSRVISNLSPWLSNAEVGEIQAVPMSHGEGRFICNEDWYNKLKNNGQIATRYVDFDGAVSMDPFFNPNGSFFAVEGITSPDGRVYGKMSHNERLGEFVAKNIPGNKEIKLFKAGVEYFK